MELFERSQHKPEDEENENAKLDELLRTAAEAVYTEVNQNQILEGLKANGGEQATEGGSVDLGCEEGEPTYEDSQMQWEARWANMLQVLDDCIGDVAATVGQEGVEAGIRSPLRAPPPPGGGPGSSASATTLRAEAAGDSPVPLVGASDLMAGAGIEHEESLAGSLTSAAQLSDITCPEHSARLSTAPTMATGSMEPAPVNTPLEPSSADPLAASPGREAAEASWKTQASPTPNAMEVRKQRARVEAAGAEAGKRLFRVAMML